MPGDTQTFVGKYADRPPKQPRHAGSARIQAIVQAFQKPEVFNRIVQFCDPIKDMASLLLTCETLYSVSKGDASPFPRRAVFNAKYTEGQSTIFLRDLLKSYNIKEHVFSKDNQCKIITMFLNNILSNDAYKNISQCFLQQYLIGLKTLNISETHIDTPAKRQTLANALPVNVKAIRLSACWANKLFEEHLTDFLQQINSPTSIVSIELFHACLNNLPTCLKRFTELQEIKLREFYPRSSDTLFSIEVLKHLGCLKVINLSCHPDIMYSYDPPKTTPLELRNAQKLEKLHLDGVVIPLPDLKMLLERTPNLEELSLECHGLESLPFVCKQLPKLRMLSIESNKLTELPTNFFSDLTHLEKLYLNWNRFSTKSPGIQENVKIFGLDEQYEDD